MNPSTLWQQILAAPGDKDLKAQYVRALERTKDPRAEVFRRAESVLRFPIYYVQHDEMVRLYECSLSDWRAEVDTTSAPWRAEVHFVSGWPIEITLDAADFCRHAADIVATLPIRHLNLRAVEEAPEVFSVAGFGQMASLSGWGHSWSDSAVTALANSPHLGSLRWVDLSETGITDAEVEILAASPHLREVVYLNLGDNPCRDPADAAAGCGVDGVTGQIVPESIWLPDFGRELEARYGRIEWLHSLDNYLERHPPGRYIF